MVINNIRHQVFLSIYMLLSLSLFISSSTLFASVSDHVIRLVPEQEIFFETYNIKCIKNSYIRNNATYTSRRNLHFKGNVEINHNNIKLGTNASVKIDNFKVKCLASNVFEKSSNTVSIDNTPKSKYNSTKNIFEMLLDESEVHPRCTDDSKDDYTIFEEQTNRSYSTGKSSSTTNQDSNIKVQINLNSLLDVLFE